MAVARAARLGTRTARLGVVQLGAAVSSNSYTQSATDSRGLLDSVATTATFSLTLSDSRGASDAIVTSAAFTSILPTDSVGRTDSVVAAAGVVRVFTDQFGQTDSATGSRGVLSHLPPDAIMLETGATGPLSYIQEDPASTDGQWLAGTGALDLRVSFGSPGGTLATGAGIQTFRVLARV